MNYQDKNSDQELNEQINDKLSQLWTGMKDKKNQMVRNLTPSYSRRVDQSDLSLQNKNDQNSNQLVKMKQKLACESSARKNRQAQIDKLKKTISQLTNDKKILVYKLQQLQRNNCSSGKKYNQSMHALNESSIQYSNFQGKTANFSTNKKKLKQTNFDTIFEKQNKIDNNTYSGPNQNFQSLSKKRLIQLLKSTAQYRRFAYYYDSHQLSYLKRLQDFHKKNCEHTASQKQKKYWAPQQILQNFKLLNKTQNFQLAESSLELILSQIKFYYEGNEEQSLKKMKVYYDNRQKKIRREFQNSIPYDLVRLSKAKERQFVAKKKRTNTLK